MIEQITKTQITKSLASEAKAWPFEEARKLWARLEQDPMIAAKPYLLLETGYGPSGLPHIGTFGEVARTLMVRHAFSLLSDKPTRLYAFSDDMDGLRRVPDNIPKPELIAPHLGKPLTEIPDPFGTHSSFGAHNNARLRGFLDKFGFEYEFQSATECYRSGRFDATLLKVLQHYEEIQALMLSTLGAERQATYSAFLPISPSSGRVLQVPIEIGDRDAGTIVFIDEDGARIEMPVTGGRTKLQWKVDWAMRWVAFGVDYEMSGKDLIPSVELSRKIAKVLGINPPDGFSYELFLDQNGQKISKSKGNGLSVEEWLTYAPEESLALFMYQQPRRAKRLYFDSIPKSVDEYLTYLANYPGEDPATQLENPAWHIHNGAVPTFDLPVSFSLLLNLAGVIPTADAALMWGFISRYRPGITCDSSPLLARLVDYAVRYYTDFIAPTKRYRCVADHERPALEDLAEQLQAAPANADAEVLQTIVYTVGKTHSFVELRLWFKTLYETLFGQEQGPRLGSFIALYGRQETAQLIKAALARTS